MTQVVFKCNKEDYLSLVEFITGQNEREESTQNTTITKSAAYASYKIKATT